jgi:hypothetical protein
MAGVKRIEKLKDVFGSGGHKEGVKRDASYQEPLLIYLFY